MAEYKRRRYVPERLIENDHIGLILHNPTHLLHGILGDTIPVMAHLEMSEAEYWQDGTQRLGGEPKRAQIDRIQKIFAFIKDRYLYLGSIQRFKSVFADDHEKTSSVSSAWVYLSLF